ncbi:pseudouridine synthase [Teratosphaeria destructans]|uniref:Pseudouridine synthase n=1 Tax=Teratosphaeria destructans TaxID=418781 RepID=A0A9W7STX1_9PEZI|nr:pseudouridine synthase [Teratosphaeria destructans]
MHLPSQLSYALSDLERREEQHIAVLSFRSQEASWYKMAFNISLLFFPPALATTEIQTSQRDTPTQILRRLEDRIKIHRRRLIRAFGFLIVNTTTTDIPRSMTKDTGISSASALSNIMTSPLFTIKATLFALTASASCAAAMPVASPVPGNATFWARAEEGNTTFWARGEDGNATFWARGVDANATFWARGVDANTTFWARGVDANDTFWARGEDSNATFWARGEQGNTTFWARGEQGNTTFWARGEEGNTTFWARGLDANNTFWARGEESNTTFWAREEDSNATFWARGVDTNDTFWARDEQTDTTFWARSEQDNTTFWARDTSSTITDSTLAIQQKDTALATQRTTIVALSILLAFVLVLPLIGAAAYCFNKRRVAQVKESDGERGLTTSGYVAKRSFESERSEVTVPSPVYSAQQQRQSRWSGGEDGSGEADQDQQYQLNHPAYV